jgi:hypothetical protein
MKGKSEITISKSQTISNIEISKCLGHWKIRIWCLEIGI